MAMRNVMAYNKLYKVFNIFIMSVVGGAALLVALAILPGMIGYHPVVVVSGSMEPSLGIGDVAVTKAVDPHTLKVDDVITFRTRLGLTTHRIIDIEQTESGRLFRTKGDSNSSPDVDLVTDARIVAKVAYSLPKVGYLMAFADSTNGMMFLIIGPTVVLILMWLRERDLKKAQSAEGASKGAAAHDLACKCFACWSQAMGIPYVAVGEGA